MIEDEIQVGDLCAHSDMSFIVTAVLPVGNNTRAYIDVLDGENTTRTYLATLYTDGEIFFLDTRSNERMKTVVVSHFSETEV